MLLNLRDTDDQKIYVSSDFHLNHDPKWENPIWRMRGYGSAKEMTDDIVDTTNIVVNPNDILLFLGDWCLNTSADQFEATLARFNCQNIYALWGNHNNPHEKKVYHTAMRGLFPNIQHGPFPPEVYPFKYKNMTFIGHYAEAVLNGQYTVLSHYPMSVFNEMSHGAWMLCGHSHYGFAPSTAENTAAKLLDVGWDGHKKPWSIPEIREVMDKKMITKVDHH